MFETWMKHAHPGLPRMAAWVMAWVMGPLIFLLLLPVDLLVHGLKVTPELGSAAHRQFSWLWRQRTTFGSDPWERAR